MDSHKRILSILHIVYGSMHILFFIVVNLLLSTILPIVEAELDSAHDEEELAIVKMVFYFVRSVFFILIILVPLPSIIGGIGQLNGKKWGMTVMLISGCIALLSFPIGTILGIYTLWVYLENQKSIKLNDENQG